MGIETSSNPDIPPAIFLGYCAKEHWPTPNDWRAPRWSAHVAEVCSVSDCIASRPCKWIDRWDFNRASCWHNEALALACISPEDQTLYRLYAYRAFPLIFGKSAPPDRRSQDELFNASLPELPAEPDLSEYDCLGYDVVEYIEALNYGCSPLSCNGMGEEYPVNRYCLLDNLQEAYQAALAFGIEEPEPGPYILFEVWRKRTEEVRD